jgi:hypothetical protein
MNGNTPGIKIEHEELRSIRELLRQREKNIILKGADLLTTEGFTQVPNHILRSEKLSPGAKLTYAMLLSYAWNNEFCFPGQDRLGQDMGVTDRSVRTYTQELETHGFLKVKRRGLNKTNVYELDLTVNNRRKQGTGRK